MSTLFTSRQRRSTALAGGIVLTLFTSCSRPPAAPPQNQPAQPATVSGEPTPAPAPTTPAVAPPANAPTAPPIPVKPRPPKVKGHHLRSVPPEGARFWGKKKLGETRVTLERPRDSGPVDFVIRNDGYFPLHTRAYTFHNDTVYARLTKLEDRMTLFGAKHDATTQLPAAPPGSDPGTASPHLRAPRHRRRAGTGTHAPAPPPAQ